MNDRPDRNAVRDLYHRVVDLTPEERGPILDAADPEISQEVQRLLAHTPSSTDSADLEEEAPPDLVGFEVLGQIDAGGMGVVWRVRDLQFQRLLAIKVMKAMDSNSPNAARRFFTEAQIIGQLAHPFIVPIHAMGRLSDSRPYYTMKLVEGKTLADLLPGRVDAASRRMEFVQIFSQVCQAVAFAHKRAIIHRDLKPKNVMVGEHGEVQVMDWGLTKALARTGPGPVEPTDGSESPGDLVPGDSINTRTGQALGTWPYMPPEQARGEVTEVDQRSDVFGLGAILCEILTGAPPYTGPHTSVAAQQAHIGNALARLRTSGWEPELIDLAGRCLAPRKSDRPADAGAVAAAVAAYQSAVEARLQEERLERERHKLKAAKERRRRKLWVALAAVAVVAVAVVATAGVYAQRLWAQQQYKSKLAQQEVDHDLVAAEALLETEDFEKAQEPLSQAKDRLEPDGPPHSRERLRRLTDAWNLAHDLEDIQLRRTSPLSNGLFDNATAQNRYVQTFNDAGLSLETATAAELADAIRVNPAKTHLLNAFDNWALVCAYDIRFDPERKNQHRRRRDRLLELARAVDPDPHLRDGIRNPQNWNDRQDLEKLAKEAQKRSASPHLAAMLAFLLESAGGNPEVLLRAYQRRHPDDFWLNFDLGKLLYRKKPDDALRFYQAALALRPRNTIVLHNIGLTLLVRKDRDLDGAIGYFEQVLDIDPSQVNTRLGLGEALLLKGQDFKRANEQYRLVSQQSPQDALIHAHMADSLMAQNEVTAAIAYYRRAVNVFPQFLSSHPTQLYINGHPADEKKVQAVLHVNLGIALRRVGLSDEAVQQVQEGLSNFPEYNVAHYHLANALWDNQDFEAAMVEADRAVKLDGTHAKAHQDYGEMLRQHGEFEQGLQYIRRAQVLSANKLGRNRLPERFLRDAERTVDLDRKLPGILVTPEKIGDVEEAFYLGETCHFKKWYADSARLYADALHKQPTLTDHHSVQRFRAACSAVLAGSGQGDRVEPLSEAGRRELRKQALDWLIGDN